MKIKILILTVFFLGSCSKETSKSNPIISEGPNASECTTGTNSIYIDATNGNDANSGESSCLAFKTLYKASASLLDGMTVNLKKGETWFNEYLLIDKNNITVDAYGSGNDPIINGSKEINGWIHEGSGIYSLIVNHAENAQGGGLGNLSRDSVMMTFRPWDTDATTTFASAIDHSFSYVYATKTLYIKSSTDPDLSSFRASTKLFGIETRDDSEILVQNIKITRFSLNAVYFYDCVNCTAKNLTITNGGGTITGANSGGGSADYIYAGNGIEFDNNSTGGLVENVTIDSIFDSCISPQIYISNQTMNNITFKNSTLSKCGYAGVEISILYNGGSVNNTLSNTTIENLTISDVGTGWSKIRYGEFDENKGTANGIIIESGADPTGATSSGNVSGTIIRDTKINGSKGTGILLKGEVGDVTIQRSLINGSSGYGIFVFANPSEVPTTPKINLYSSLVYDNSKAGFSYSLGSALGFELIHNTFSNNGSVIQLEVYLHNGSGVVKNNIFQSSSAMTQLYFAPGISIGATNINNNCYENGTNMFGYDSSAYSLVSSFKSAHGFEANGIGTGSINFTDLNAKKFSLATGSACLTLGNNATTVISDYNGVSYGSSPHAGALAE
ncbi:MAG: hypothetical protein HON90_07215 [Halobacteriovoraceae bacterium]|jgi:hypothetical protein|nr:hypothetical protein [Halobacteriovoraceae bacterium]